MWLLQKGDVLTVSNGAETEVVGVDIVANHFGNTHAFAKRSKR